MLLQLPTDGRDDASYLIVAKIFSLMGPGEEATGSFFGSVESISASPAHVREKLVGRLTDGRA